MKNKTLTPSRFTLLALVLASMLVLSSCASIKAGVGDALKGDIQQGAWSADGKVFTNEWSNLKFTMPDEGYVALAKEQIDEMMQAGMEATGQKGTVADIAMMRIVYDFVISAADTGTPNVTLAYENVGNNAATKNIDENGYFDAMQTQFEQVAAQGLTYTELGRSTATIAGIEWKSSSYSLNDIANQDYYLHLSDGYMWQLIITYDSNFEQAAKDLIAGITSVK